MSNRKKQWSNKRQLKVPQKFNDHIMSNVSQRRKVNNELDGENEDNANGTDEGVSSDLNHKEEHDDNITVSAVETDATMHNDCVPVDNASFNNMDNCDKNTSMPVENSVDKSGNCNTPMSKEQNDDIEKPKDMYNTDSTRKYSYANMVKKDEVLVNKKLHFVAPKVTKEGAEFVIFDEEIVIKGSEKWKLSACGYFVGHKMLANELRYHLRRMWAKYGLRDVIVNSSGMHMFKFKDEQGMKAVIEQSPWMVNNVPLFVQNWNADVGMKKTEPSKMPLWVKMVNVPMEAWSVDGISSMASSLGTPIVMDNMTALMFQHGVGRLDYARVLVEFDATKKLKESISIQYTDKEQNVKGTTEVKVEYD